MTGYIGHDLIVSDSDWHAKIHDELGNKISSDAMEKWLNKNMKCKGCGQICRTWESVKWYNMYGSIVKKPCPVLDKLKKELGDD